LIAGKIREAAMMNAGAQWLRERSQQFRDRAEQVANERTKASLLNAAVIYERSADLIEAKDRRPAIAA
jgi:hypothetical protein